MINEKDKDHERTKQEDTAPELRMPVIPSHVSVLRVPTHEHAEPRVPTSEQQRIERALLKAFPTRAGQKDTAPEPQGCPIA